MDILLMEDAKSIRETFERILSLAGHNVTAVRDLSEVSIEDIQRFDFLVTDVMVDNEEQGFELAEQVRNKSNAPILFVSGKSDPVGCLKAAMYKPSDFLVKPVGAAYLVDAVHELYASSQSMTATQSEFDHSDESRSMLQTAHQKLRDIEKESRNFLDKRPGALLQWLKF